VGKRYTQEEISQIQTLTDEGLTDGQIATSLNRSENAIRNLRHRNKLKTETRETIESLKLERRTLNEKIQDLRWELSTLQTRKEYVSKAARAKACRHA
jgi:orotate phosphoribosyltransferase-like protein